MAYLIAALVMTLSVLEGHSPIASLFKCGISYLCTLRSPTESAELLVLSAMGTLLWS